MTPAGVLNAPTILSPPASLWRQLVRVSFFIVTYLIAFSLSTRVYGTSGLSSPFWFPDSVLLSALLLAPREQWWIFLVAIWPLRLLSGARPGTPLWFQLVSIANDALKGLASAWLIQRFVGRRIRLETLNELLAFFGIAAVAMPLASTVLVMPARYALGDPVWRGAYGWFLGDALTQIIVTPTLLYWFTGGFRHARARLKELVFLCAGLVLASSYAFVLPGSSHSATLLYVPVPFLLWAAVRFSPFGTANAISLVAVIAMVGAMRGTGLFAAGAFVLELQLFLLVLSTSLLVLAVVMTERTALVVYEKNFSTLLLRAQERERARIARELHDDVGQQLTLLKLSLRRLADESDEDAGSTAVEAAEYADNVATSLHDLSHSLHPARLHLLGLVPAVKGMIDEVSQHGPRMTFTYENVPGTLDQDTTVALFRVLQEAVKNAVKHSHASHLSVELRGGLTALTISVVDDGVGFVVDARWGHGLGLISMDERVQAIGGTLKVQSSPRRGTRVTIRVPLPTTTTDVAMA
jgi:two-component system sensor histidine kinase UhpB